MVSTSSNIESHVRRRINNRIFKIGSRLLVHELLASTDGACSRKSLANINRHF